MNALSPLQSKQWKRKRKKATIIHREREPARQTSASSLVPPPSSFMDFILSRLPPSGGLNLSGLHFLAHRGEAFFSSSDRECKNEKQNYTRYTQGWCMRSIRGWGLKYRCRPDDLCASHPWLISRDVRLGAFLFSHWWFFYGEILGWLGQKRYIHLTSVHLKNHEEESKLKKKVWMWHVTKTV